MSATQVLVWIDVGWACQGVFLDAGYSTEGDDGTRSVWGFGKVRQAYRLPPQGMDGTLGQGTGLGTGILTGMWGKINVICGQGLLTRLDIGGECGKSLYGTT